MKLDALGNPIVIGNSYGYTQSVNGISTATLGIAVRETEKGVTLRTVSKVKALYYDDPTPCDIDKNSSNVKAIHLFPVDMSTVNASKHIVKN